MKRLLLVLFFALLFVPARHAPAAAAELAVTSPDLEPAPPVRHHVRRLVRRHYVGCPDGYSCYPLYGAYGPYGGRAYWSAYTAGWYR